MMTSYSKNNLFAFFILLFCFGTQSNLLAQVNTIDSLNTLIKTAKKDTLKVNLMLELSKNYFGSDPEKSIEIGESALILAQDIDFPSGQGYAFKNIGIGHYYLSNDVEALDHWERAQKIFEKLGDRKGVANMLSNMGAIYTEIGEDNKAINLFLEALKIAEEIHDTLRIASALQNIGSVVADKPKATLQESTEYYLRALPLFKILNDPDGIGLTTINVGVVFLNYDELDSAKQYLFEGLPFLRGSFYYSECLALISQVYYHEDDLRQAQIYADSAYSIAVSLNDPHSISRALEEQSSIFLNIGNYDKVISINLEILSLESLESYEKVYKDLVAAHSKKGDYKKAMEYQALLTEELLRLNDNEANRNFNKILFNAELDRKKSEILLLNQQSKLEKTAHRKESEKQRIIIASIIVGLLLVVAFLIFAFNRLKVTRRQKVIIEKEKDRSEELLLNILPEEIAKELKEKGSADAQLIDLVTVLFTDFKGFTALSEILSPENLVKEINECFSAFDYIMGKHNIEKIKTIGDAYMAAGGLPTVNETHAIDVVRAALEIQEFMLNHAEEKKAKNESYFEIRIGVHTGPVVAGIVGVKKFQYDIWGDTVNTASRMESSGGVGRVNISESTYEIVKEVEEYTFESRGKVEAKGKGMMEMFFVEKK